MLRAGIDMITSIACALAALFTLADIHTPVRSGLTVVALVIGTGWGATCWIRLRDAAFAATVAIATGVSIVCFYALLFVEIHWWHPIGSIGGLLITAAGINAVALAWELTHGRSA